MLSLPTLTLRRRLALRYPAACGVLACWLAMSLGGYSAARANGRAVQAGQHGGPSIAMDQLRPESPQVTPSVSPPAVDQALQRLRAQAGVYDEALDHSAPPVATERRPSRRAPTQAPARNTTAQRDASWTLGLLALHGIAMPQDAAQASDWFERAQKLGHPLAPAGLAWCQIDGCSGPANPAAARPWIAQLRAADPGRALYLDWWLAMRLAPLATARPSAPGETQAPESVPHLALLQRAAAAGSLGALSEVALDNVAQGHLLQAREQFQKAAATSPAAAANLRLLDQRLHDESNRVTPPASQQRTAEQWFEQARRYHRGDGVPANFTEAIRLYQTAANLGSRTARRMLSLIYSRPAPDGSVNVAWMSQLASMDVTREGALLSILPAPSPPLYGRDPTPLYDLVPAQWRALKGDLRGEPHR